MLSLGFNKNQRLLNSADFKALHRAKIKIKAEGFFLVAKYNDLHCSRLGLAIAKRFVKSAVKRNRIKRIIRESFRLNTQRLPNVDMMILLKTGTVATLSNSELHRCIEHLWQRLAKQADSC